MPARLLVIGFDSFEATLVDQLVAAGVLPTFARLRQQGTTAELANRVELAHDTAWIELATGRSAARLGWYWQPRGCGPARLSRGAVCRWVALSTRSRRMGRPGSLWLLTGCW